MKKWVFGCLGLFLVVAGVGAFLAYKFAWLPGKAYVQSFTQLQVVPELNRQVENRAPFTPPAGNTLTAAGVERFVQTQQAIRTRMGERLQQLQTRYQDLDRRYRESGEKPSIGVAMNALKDITGLFIEAKKAQVAALNATGYSLEEYEWTRARVYEALGVPVNSGFAQVIREISAGRKPDFGAMQTPAETPVPETNRALVQPHARQLTEGAALAFFAL